MAIFDQAPAQRVRQTGAGEPHGSEQRIRELSARVEELTRQLSTSQVMTQLAASAMHDLRNVLHVALSVADSLAERVKAPADQKLLRALLDAVSHGQLLTQDLLALARDSQSQGRVVECRELVPTLQRLMDQVAPKRLRCRVEVNGDVGAVMVEPSQLEAALLNLCFNARDAMPEGGDLKLRIRPLSSSAYLPGELEAGEYVEFAVIDTGHGMSKEVQARATQAFFTTKEDRGGTGLGLAMAQAFAARFGGALVLESEPGRGTCVRVILPRVKREGDHAAAEASLERTASRIRAADLRQALSIWRDLRKPGQLPRPLELGARLAKLSDKTITLAVDSTASERVLRLQRIGRALAEASPSQLAGRRIACEGPVTPGTLDAAYRRVLASGMPSYEWVHYGQSEDEGGGSFERLILPAATENGRVSHLIGVVELSGALGPGPTSSQKGGQHG